MLGVYRQSHIRGIHPVEFHSCLIMAVQFEDPDAVSRIGSELKSISEVVVNWHHENRVKRYIVVVMSKRHFWMELKVMHKR